MAQYRAVDRAGHERCKMDTQKMQELFEERDALIVRRAAARMRGDVKTAHSLNAQVGNVTRRMNDLMFKSIGECTRRVLGAK